jgi:hypothetical protein
LVAPVAHVGLGQVDREQLAGVEGDDRDLLLVDDGQNAPASVDGAHLEVVHAATSAKGDAQLVLEQCAPRLAAGASPGAAGWFADAEAAGPPGQPAA